jgi:hypothetical protein
MSKAETRKIARKFVLKHREHYSKGRAPVGVTEKEIKAAVEKVATVLHELKRPQENNRAA